MADKLKKAGIEVSAPVSKIDKSKINLSAKIEKAKENMIRAYKAVDKMNQASDSEFMDSAVLNFQRYCESVKDILLNICEYNDLKLSANRSLSEAIRKTYGVLNITKDMQEAVSKLTGRNESVHDYMNSGYFDEQVVIHLVNGYDQYLRYIDIIQAYCVSHGMI